MSNRLQEIKESWQNVKTTSRFRKLLTFFVFVVIATLFWFIMALNDNIQDDFEVKMNIYNIPDSVTFINVPPSVIHVVVRDRGTSLWRNGLFARPTLDVNFREFAEDGVFHINKAELSAGLKNVFGANANLISTSVDSLKLIYTTLPPRRVPVVVVDELTPAVGKIITGKVEAIPASISVYSSRSALDTVTRVFTEKIVRHNLEESAEISVQLHPIPGVRIVPADVKVKINVETLVRKEATVNIKIDNLPPGMDLLLFPSTAKVEYYVAMSNFNRDDMTPDIRVDYRDIQEGDKQLGLKVNPHQQRGMINIKTLTDSVEYTLVRN